jgi:anti-sigma factor RsiW
MCNFSGKLIGWIDGELPEADAIHVEQHVRQCAECRRAAGSYREISDVFLASYEAGYVAVPPGKPTRSQWRWAALAGGLAAAILVASVLTRPRQEQLPVLPPVAVHAPAIAFEKTPAHMVVVRAHHAPAPQSVRPQWIAEEPTVEVALPADALFPPGAVPAGFTFIADIRPQP